MDLLTVPPQPVTAKAPSRYRRTSGPHVADRWLRAQLPAVVLARPVDDAVPAAVWQQVAQCLESTGHAVACAQEGTDPSATAVLASIAMHETSSAAGLLSDVIHQGTRTRVLIGTGSGRRTARTLGRRPSVVPVERTWWRLAGLLAGPAPADPQVLAAVLLDHRAALADWQRILLAPARLRRLSTDRARRPA